MSLQRPNGNSSSSSSPKKHKTGTFLFVFTELVVVLIGFEKFCLYNFLEESDEELLMVPDMEAAGSTGVQSSSADDGVNNPELDPTQNGNSATKRRRGRNPVDKEYRSLKR